MFKKFRNRLVEGGWITDNGSDESSETIPKEESALKQEGNVNTATVVKKEVGNSSLAFTSSIQSTPPTQPDEKYVTFVLKELEGFNLPGVDSFELSMAMRNLINNKGMPLQVAIVAAFEAFKTAHPDLTVQSLLSSCDHYLQKLDDMLIEFDQTKDGEISRLGTEAQNKINLSTKKQQDLEAEEQKILERLKSIQQEKQQVALAVKDEETNLATKQHELQSSKIHMKLAVVKVAGVIKEDKNAILQHLNPSKND
jgi:hypothetical protein